MRQSKSRKPKVKVSRPSELPKSPREKVGIIFECGDGGPDVLVCRHLIKMMEADIDIEELTLDDKPKLLKQCADKAKLLLSQGCTRVVILWDLYPSEHGSPDPPCLHNDRVVIKHALDAAGLTDAPIHMVCIHNELESWLVYDPRALAGYFSRKAHQVSERDVRVSPQLTNPKAPLKKFFNQYRGRRYSDFSDALRIIQNLPDLSRLRRDASFARFEQKVTGR